MTEQQHDKQSDNLQPLVLLELKKSGWNNNIQIPNLYITSIAVSQKEYDFVYEYVLKLDEVGAREEKDWIYHHRVIACPPALISSFQELYPNGLYGVENLWTQVYQKAVDNKATKERQKERQELKENQENEEQNKKQEEKIESNEHNEKALVLLELKKSGWCNNSNTPNLYITTIVVPQHEYDFAYNYLLYSDEPPREEKYWEYYHRIITRDLCLISAFQQLYPTGLCSAENLWTKVYQKALENKSSSELYQKRKEEKIKLRAEGKMCRVYDVTPGKEEEEEKNKSSDCYRYPRDEIGNKCTVQELIGAYRIRNTEELKQLHEELRDGDFIDTDGYRGIGLWLYMKGCLFKTEEDYGYIIPSVGFCKVLEHGL